MLGRVHGAQLPFPKKRQILLLQTKIIELGENGINFSRPVEDTVGKGEIARDSVSHSVFKHLYSGHVKKKTRLVWERVKSLLLDKVRGMLLSLFSPFSTGKSAWCQVIFVLSMLLWAGRMVSRYLHLVQSLVLPIHGTLVKCTVPNCLMHILPAVTAEGFDDGSHHPRYAE